LATLTGVRARISDRATASKGPSITATGSPAG
jgi:hypothetical protein